MIYCVRFDEIDRHLTSAGFREIGRGSAFRSYQGPDGRTFIIRPPNVHGYLPEAIVDVAFDAAGLEPPKWSLFWGD